MKWSRVGVAGLVVAACAAAVSAPLRAQSVSAHLAPPQNVVQLSATGSVEVPQDYLSLTLAATREAADAAAVQAQLKTAIDAALAEARKAASPGQMEVRSGGFSLYPRHSKEGRITTWVGTADIVLHGRDFARITSAAGRVTGLVVQNVDFSLSREERARVEAQAQAMAIERFKAKAGEIARGFGFADYGLREVSVNANDGGGGYARAMPMQAKAMSADMAPVPVEAGKSTVQVTVSGGVQLR
jgi:predicted secreted protein